MESLPEEVRASAPETSAERLSVATRGRLQRRRYVFHADAGHGWLAVKRADLELLGIAGDVSSCSYQRGGTVYLEEDRDAGLFVHAFYAAVGREPTIKRGASPDRSPIRSYASYVPDPSDETLAEVIDNAAAELGFRNGSDDNDAGSSSVGEILPGRDITRAAVPAAPAVPVFETRLAKIAEGGPGYGEPITGTSEACRIVWPYFAERFDCEEFAIVTLDTKHKVTGIVRITRGTLDASLVHPREVFRAAIAAGAAAVLLVHNHPSGDTTPSREDRLVTDRLEKAGELIGITVLDHLIVANGGCLSLREGGAA